MSQLTRTSINIIPPGVGVQTLTGNTGGAVGPDSSNNINVVGDGTTIEVMGNPGSNTLTISTSGSMATTYDTDSGSATPSGGVLTITGGTTGLTFSGSGSTVTLNASNLNLPSTTATVGQITIGGSPFLFAGSSSAYVGDSGNFTTNGTRNIGMGLGALGSLTTGSYNIGIGPNALLEDTTGSDNIGIGFGTLGSLSSGINNIAIGTDGVGGGALKGIGSGSYNVAIGYTAGSQNSGSDSSNILISNVGVNSESNTIRIGTNGSGSGQQNACYIAGIDGVNVGSVATVVTEASNKLGTAVITAGTGISVTPGANTITIAATGTTNLSYTNVNTSPYVVLSTDEYLSVDCSGGAITIELPNAATSGRTYIIKDRTGSAATNNITVTTVGGAVDIDGATTFVMNTNYEAINVMGNATSYEVF